MKSRTRFRIIFIIIGLVTCLNQVLSQAIREISNYRYFDYRNGLPENNIQEFLSDKQNAYWLRAEKNIIYFNGHDFIAFNKGNNLFRLSSEEIVSFNIYQNKLYVFGDAGVDEINTLTKKVRQVFDNKNKLLIKSGFVTSKGAIILVDGDGVIYRISEGKVVKLEKIQYFTQCTILETTDGTIFITSSNQEVLLFNSALKVINRIKFEGEYLLTAAIYNYPGVGTVLATKKNIYKYDIRLNKLVKANQIKSFKRLFWASGDNLYDVSAFKSILLRKIKSDDSVRLSINLKINYYINQISTDEFGTVVLCTNQGFILFKEPNSAFEAVPKPTGSLDESGNTRRAVLETKTNQLLQISYQGIDLYDPVKNQNRRIFARELNGYSGFLDGNDLWVGTDGNGLIHFTLNDHKTIKSVRLFDKPASEGVLHVTAINKFNDSTFLVGTSLSGPTLKLYNIKKNQYTNLSIDGWEGEKFYQKITAIIKNDDHTFWICTNNGLLIIGADKKLLKWINADKLGTGVVNYFYAENKRNIWIATDQGILLYDISEDKVLQRFNVENGLAGNKCVSIIPDQYNTLWVPTFTGLSRVDLKTKRIINFYVEDGLADNEYNYNATFKSSSGDIYLGGLNTYTKIKPVSFPAGSDRTNLLGLDYSQISNKNGSRILDTVSSEAIRLHHRDDRLTVVFSMKDHLYSDRISYEYFIEGLFKEWISLKGLNQLDIDYLPPGQYRIRIRGVPYNSILNASEISFPIRVYAYWFESKYFYLFIVLLMLALITAVFNYRYNALRNVGKVRTALANDIHDEIGTMLTKAVLKTELLRHKTGNTYPELPLIEKNLRDAVFSFRTILWSLNTDNRKMDDFIGMINMILYQTFEQTHFHYLVTNHSPNVFFNKSIKVKRNLLLIFKELAHNALKHSSGNLFEVIIRSDGNKWYFLVVDNGANDQKTISESGLGLKSIRKRVKELNGSVELEKKQIGFYISIKI